jgi:hypothetical protein
MPTSLAVRDEENHYTRSLNSNITRSFIMIVLTKTKCDRGATLFPRASIHVTQNVKDRRV